MSFLEKEEETKSSTFWDWVVGIGLVLVIGGFTVFYQYQKRSSLTRFQQADALFLAHNLKEAGKMYDELKSAQYLTPKDDSTIYARMDTVETTIESQNLLIKNAKTKLASDTTLNSNSKMVVESLKAIRYPDLLSEADKLWFDSVTKM